MTTLRSLALAVALLSARPSAEAQEQAKAAPTSEQVKSDASGKGEKPPGAAESEGLLARLMTVLALPRDVLISVLRGDEPELVGRIVVGKLQDGRVRVLAQTERDDLRSPLFDPGSKHLIALASKGLVSVGDAGKVTALGSATSLAPLEIRALLGWEEKHHWLVALFRDGTVRLLDVSTMTWVPTSASTLPDARLSKHEAQQVIAAARTCKGKTLEVREQPARGTRRLDVGMRDAADNAWRNLTGELASYNYSDPTFLPGCKRIAFVATY